MFLWLNTQKANRVGNDRWPSVRRAALAGSVPGAVALGAGLARPRLTLPVSHCSFLPG